MLKYLLLFSVIGFAEEISLSAEKYNGESSYIVTKPNQKLKAKLLFPFSFNAINISFKNRIYDYDIAFSSSFLLNRTLTEGKDYDWKDNQLTVFSTSQNSVEKFHRYNLKISKNFIEDIDFFTNIQYQALNFKWSNTVEKDFVKDKISTNNKLSLEYQQKFYQLNLGLKYTQNFGTLLFEVEPSFIYAHVRAKDTHLLRYFYTKQNNNAFGYGINVKGKKNLTQNSSFLLYYNYETYQDKNSDMDYYNSFNYNYSTLPSSYHYNNSVMGFSYAYRF